MTAFFLVGAGLYGLQVGTSWVFTVYFCTQGFIFFIFALSLVEAFNLQPPPEAQLLGLAPPPKTEAELMAGVSAEMQVSIHTAWVGRWVHLFALWPVLCRAFNPASRVRSPCKSRS